MDSHYGEAYRRPVRTNGKPSSADAEASVRPERRREAAGELIGILAHELRNPLASLQGCALTLMERSDEMSADMRQGLMQVIVGQSRRLDWLVGAVAALGGVTRRLPGDVVDVAKVVREAGELVGIPVEAGEGVRFEGDERRVRLAVEALLMALTAGGAEGSLGVKGNGRALEVTSAAQDMDRGGRRWKLDLARSLLREEGCSLRISRTPDGTKARIGFPQLARKKPQSRSRRTA